MDCDQALDRIRPFFTIFIDGRRLTCISRTSRCYGKLQASISFALLAITCVTRWTRQCCNNLSRLIPPPMYRSSELLQWFGKIRLPLRTKADSLNRTGDIRVTNPLFYQLNYAGMCGLYSMWKKETWSKSIEYHFSFRRAVTADATCYPGATRTRAGSGIRTPARFPAFRFSRPTPSTAWVILPILYFTICQPCVKLTGKYNHPKTDPKDFVKLSSFSFVPSFLFKLNFEF